MLWDLLKSRMQLRQSAFICDEEKRLSYAEVVHKAEKMGKQLKRLSPYKLKCIIFCKREFNTALAILGCFCAGHVPILLSEHYGRDHNKKIVELILPDLIITDEINYARIADEDKPCFLMPEEVLVGKVAERALEKELEDVAIMMCTSGTSGRAKGVMITQSGIITNLLDIVDYFKVSHDDHIMITRPLYHGAVLTGEFLVALYQGTNIYFLTSVFNPALNLRYLQEKGITVCCGTPTLFRHLALYMKRRGTPIQLRTIVLSGELLLRSVAAVIREQFPSVNIYHVYGLTEASPRVSFLPPKLFDTCPQSVGFPLRSVIVKIVDEKGKEQPPGVVGKVLIRGPNVMKGYYRNAQQTKLVLKDGWLDTGDLAYKDASGLLYIQGRADEMMIKAGMNIYPQEIETTLKTSPFIEAVVAYGSQTAEGQAIGIKVVLSEEGINMDTKALMAECARLLPRYQLPDFICIVDQLPMNASGKIVRKDRGI